MKRPFSALSARPRAVFVLATAVALGGMALSAGTAGAAPAATAPPYSCAPNGPAGNQTVYGTFGDASVIGWAGNSQGVVACLGGSFWVDTSGPDGGPGSGSTAAVTGTSYGYGVYDDSTTTWANAGGYLPALVTGFHRDGAAISITDFGDDVTIGGHAYVVIYSRVSVTNPTGAAISIDPQPSAGLIPLNSAPDAVPAHATVNHDYAVASDRFGGSYAFPSASALAAAGGFSQHFAHMRSYWNSQLAGIAQIQALPDQGLIDAYKTGFIYTQIIRSGDELKTGANGYDKEFSHDVIGILANLFNQGYTTGAHGLLDRARYVIGTQTQYDDGVWTYPWIWALYLLKTGDLSFVKANFATEGPAGATEPSIQDTAHLIAADRTGPGGIMEETNDIDANGYWTIDNYEALMGLWAYRWIAQQVGSTSEATWATSQYDSLLAATNATLNATISANHLTYLPCSMTEPNTDNRCVNAEDANWAGMANANLVLLDSLAAQRSDGSLVVGRGVPSSWVTSGQVISLANFPATGGRHLGLTVRTSGSSVTLTLSGPPPAGPVLFQLPAFVGNITHASAGTTDEKTGTVTLAPTVRSVTVQLAHPEA